MAGTKTAQGFGISSKPQIIQTIWMDEFTACAEVVGEMDLLELHTSGTAVGKARQATSGTSAILLGFAVESVIADDDDARKVIGYQPVVGDQPGIMKAGIARITNVQGVMAPGNKIYSVGYGAIGTAGGAQLPGFVRVGNDSVPGGAVEIEFNAQGNSA